MLPQTLSASHPDMVGNWLIMIGFGAYHGLNPGMGWLFALALGLQQRSERAIWVSLLPISAGHAASIVLVAIVVLVMGHLIPFTTFRFITAGALLGFGIYKLFNYYRHPRWVGMRVGMRDLFAWSFLMAIAHGAGLMVAPTLLALIGNSSLPEASLTKEGAVLMAVVLHTLAMLLVMACIAWIVYKKLGLMVLRKSWINFDLIWAAALIVVGGVSLFFALN